MKRVKFKYNNDNWVIYKHLPKQYRVIDLDNNTLGLTAVNEKAIHILDTKESFTIQTVLHELFHVAMYYERKKHKRKVQDVEELAAELFCNDAVSIVKLGKMLYNKLKNRR